MACVRIRSCYSSLVIAVRMHAGVLGAINKLHHAAGLHVASDRSCYFENLAFSSQMSADNGDIRGIFGIVKKICGFRIRAPKVVKLKNGTLSSSEDERQQRWQEKKRQRKDEHPPVGTIGR